MVATAIDLTNGFPLDPPQSKLFEAPNTIVIEIVERITDMSVARFEYRNDALAADRHLASLRERLAQQTLKKFCDDLDIRYLLV